MAEKRLEEPGIERRVSRVSIISVLPLHHHLHGACQSVLGSYGFRSPKFEPDNLEDSIGGRLETRAGWRLFGIAHAYARKHMTLHYTEARMFNRSYRDSWRYLKLASVESSEFDINSILYIFINYTEIRYLPLKDTGSKTQPFAKIGTPHIRMGGVYLEAIN